MNKRLKKKKAKEYPDDVFHEKWGMLSRTLNKKESENNYD